MKLICGPIKMIDLRGWPEHRGQVPSQITPYFSMRGELTTQNGVIFRPLSSRRDMKQMLHAVHFVSNPVYDEHGKPSFGPV